MYIAKLSKNPSHKICTVSRSRYQTRLTSINNEYILKPITQSLDGKRVYKDRVINRDYKDEIFNFPEVDLIYRLMSIQYNHALIRSVEHWQTVVDPNKHI